MDRDRAQQSAKLLNLKQAAQKLQVSVETLQYICERYALVPVIDPRGEFKYDEDDLINLLNKFKPQDIHTQPQTNTISPNTQKESKFGFFESTIGAVADKMDEIGKQKGSFKSDFQEYVQPDITMPGKKFVVSGMLFALILTGLIAHLILGRISDSELAQRASNQSKVLGEETSKLKLSGNIILALPLTAKENILVEGEGVFIGNLTAPNILYGVEAGEGIEITGDEQRPTISVDFTNAVTSFQGEQGDIELLAGSDISIDGLTINDISTLETVVSRGTCSGCITDSSVVNTLTIDAGGTINAEAVKNGCLEA